MIATLTVSAAAQPAEPWPDMPIEPAWIKKGNPLARGAIVQQSADKKLSSGYWTCTPGVFEWHYAWDEFVHLFEGEVTITDESGRSQTLRANDTAHFPMGMKTTWEVRQTVKKFFVVRSPEPLIL